MEGVSDTDRRDQSSGMAVAGYDEFVAGRRRDLERALVARYGLDVGLDAAAEALAYAWAEWPRVSEMDNPVGYLFRVGQTHAGRRFRSRRTVDLPRHTSAPEATSTRLHDALLRLKPEQRAAVILVHSHRYSYDEAAAMLDMPVSTLKNHLNRGLALLRRHMETIR